METPQLNALRDQINDIDEKILQSWMRPKSWSNEFELLNTEQEN